MNPGSETSTYVFMMCLDESVKYRFLSKENQNILQLQILTNKKQKIWMFLFFGVFCRNCLVCPSQRAITASSYYKSFPCNNLLTPDQTRKEQRYKGTKGQRDKETKFQKEKGKKEPKNHPTSRNKKKHATSRDKKKSRNLLGLKKSSNFLGQKESTQPLRTKQNHATSRDKKNSCNLLG